jgi:hypothetical protein
MSTLSLSRCDFKNTANQAFQELGRFTRHLVDIDGAIPGSPFMVPSTVVWERKERPGVLEESKLSLKILYNTPRENEIKHPWSYNLQIGTKSLLNTILAGVSKKLAIGMKPIRPTGSFSPLP